MTQLLPFFIVLFAGLFFSDVFSRLHIPWVVALILGGILIGPSAFGIFEADATIDFIGQIGLIFLMFMAGLETNFSTFKKNAKNIVGLSLFNGLLPFIVGVGIGFAFGYSLIVSLLIGIIFISSSIAVVMPSLEVSGLLRTRIGNYIVSATVIEDIISLVFFSVLFQTISPITSLSLPVFYILLAVFLVFFRWLVPKLQWLLTRLSGDRNKLFQPELQVMFVILIGIVITFELLGLHPIIAGFFAGAVLSSSIHTDILKDKLKTLSYGLFIPIFFIVIGSKTDLSVFTQLEGAGLIALVIILGSMLAKFISGWFGGRISGFSTNESAFIGASTIPQLSTTLAAAFAGFEFGLLDQRLLTALVLLSIVTTIVGPMLMRTFRKKAKEKSSDAPEVVDIKYGV
ncbi:hypothetical protein COB64_02285 [Candidatus Wolfebacteria bacterium]|nr:MAG: hypothetical protein COB64_02285 [Candidatus Wolfebacteria bacterium]